jgi:DNA mismatch repair protein MutL
MWRDFSKDLAILGVDAEEFGGRTILLRGVPPSWERDPAGMLREVLQDLSEGRRRDRERAQRVAASFACRSAVRSGQELTLPEMNALVDQLFATSLPHGDPHGRPTFLQVTLEDLDRRFGRLGH